MFFSLVITIIASGPEWVCAQGSNSDAVIWGGEISVGSKWERMKERQYSSVALAGNGIEEGVAFFRKAGRSMQKVEGSLWKSNTKSVKDPANEQEQKNIQAEVSADWQIWNRWRDISFRAGVGASYYRRRRQYLTYVNFRSAGEDIFDIGPTVSTRWKIIPEKQLLLEASLSMPLFALLRQQPYGGAVEGEVVNQSFKAVSLQDWQSIKYRIGLDCKPAGNMELGIYYTFNWLRIEGSREVRSLFNGISVSYRIWKEKK